GPEDHPGTQQPLRVHALEAEEEWRVQRRCPSVEPRDAREDGAENPRGVRKGEGGAYGYADARRDRGGEDGSRWVGAPVGGQRRRFCGWGARTRTSICRLQRPV